MKFLKCLPFFLAWFPAVALSQSSSPSHTFGTNYHQMYVKKVPLDGQTCVVVAVEGGEGAGTDISCFKSSSRAGEPVLLLERTLTYHKVVIATVQVDGKTCTATGIDGGEGADAAIECL